MAGWQHCARAAGEAVAAGQRSNPVSCSAEARYLLAIQTLCSPAVHAQPPSVQGLLLDTTCCTWHPAAEPWPTVQGHTHTCVAKSMRPSAALREGAIASHAALPRPFRTDARLCSTGNRQGHVEEASEGCNAGGCKGRQANAWQCPAWALTCARPPAAALPGPRSERGWYAPPPTAAGPPACTMPWPSLSLWKLNTRTVHVVCCPSHRERRYLLLRLDLLRRGLLSTTLGRHIRLPDVQEAIAQHSCHPCARNTNSSASPRNPDDS